MDKMNVLRYTSFLLCLYISIILYGQSPSIFKGSIHSLQTVAEQRWTSLPIITLNSGEVINIDFDDFTHESMRYTYRIEPYTADWKLNASLFESDYIDGFTRDNLIEESELSVNTNTLYTHYHFSVPNEKCRLKISGNYCITVFDENNDNEPVFKTYFMVVENVATIKMSATSNTDKEVNTKYQQIEADIKYNNIRINDWKKEIKTYFLQNNRWDAAVVNPTPKYIRTDGLTWVHNAQLIFEGGNEYHKFEILDVNHSNMGVESTEWDGTEYHTYLFPNEPCANYLYDEDANGAYFIRNSDNYNNNNFADYQIVHFYLNASRINGDVYINGMWTYDNLSPQYLMHWNEDAARYETSIKLKQGYYNYQYLWKTPTEEINFIPSQGNFYQTENCYTSLVYYRSPASRYDRLIGYANLYTR